MRPERWTSALLLSLMVFVGLGLAGCPDKPAGKADGDTAKATKGVDTPGAPVIACDEATHDFGTVAQGQEVKHTFTVKNTGTATLNIKRAKGG